MDFINLKDKVEETYSKTRIIHKPTDYILDQDHHHHLANQFHTFDWQFYSELHMYDKIEKQHQRQRKKNARHRRSYYAPGTRETHTCWGIYKLSLIHI